MREPRRTPSVALSVAIFLVTVLGMAYLRLVVYGDRTLSLGSALPLAICLWQRDRRLLWAMAAGLACVSFFKIGLLGRTELPDAEVLTQGAFQLLNIAVMGVAMDSVLRMTERVRAKNEELQAANAELAAREAEIRAQNEEIQSQSEELQRQNEELRQQSEELSQQAEELHAVSSRLGHRERLLEALLAAVPKAGEDRVYLEKVCAAMIELFEGRAVAAAVLEVEDAEFAVRAYVGPGRPARERLPLEKTFSALVLHQGRAAFVEDLEKRPDLHVPAASARSVFAAPLRGGVKGTVEAYAAAPHEWTEEEFRVIEWMATQASLVLAARRLRSGLERDVAARTAELKALVEELQHFSYSITHDMRAPLRSMRGFAELLSERVGPTLDEESRDYLRRIIESSGRMDRLITDSLSYAKALREPLALEAVDVEGLIRGMMDTYPSFQSPRAEIQIDGPLPPVMGNPAGLTQCFSNLLGNAVKFVKGGEKARVRIRGERENGRVRLWFEDRGIGISPQMMPKLFLMFQRESKDYDGTGIGLALVRKVVEHMGGQVGVESERGEGSRFWIDLRAAERPAE